MEVTINPRVYTTTELNTVLENLVCAMSDAGTKQWNGIAYGASCGCTYRNLTEQLLWAWYLISSWQQTPTGNTAPYTNRVTQTELTATVMWAKRAVL